MKKTLIYIILISYLILIIKYQFPLFEIMVAILNVLLACSFISKINSFKDNIFRLYLLGYLYCSIFVVVIFELNGVGFFKNVITYDEYRDLTIWGNHLYLIIFLVFSISSLFIKKRRYEIIAREDVVINNHDIVSGFKRITIIVYVLCIVSIVLGLYDAMEPARTVLPLHLNGIINETCYTLYPFIFSLYVYDCFSNNRKLNRNCIVLFIVYLFLEIVVTSSKGVFIQALIPAALVAIFCGRFTKKFFIKYCLPLLVVTYLLYPIISLARQEGVLSMSSMSAAYAENKTVDKSEQSSPFVRAFLTGVYYLKVKDEVDNDYLSFDFRHVPYLFLNGGGAVYMTREIDQMPENVHHGSGITGLPDAILWGGYLMCYIVLAIFAIISCIGDKASFFHNSAPYQVILFSFLQTLIANRSITFFFDNLFFSAFISIILRIFIVIYYKKKYVRKESVHL